MRESFLRSLQGMVLVAAMALVSGCRSIQSELQKSEIKAASTNAVCKDGELRLSSTLKKATHEGRKGFDLQGKILVSAASGTIPASVNIFQLSLKPSWKGWPGYFVMNAYRHKRGWKMDGDIYSPDLRFGGTSRTENGDFVIEFVWYDQGMSGKPEHFAAYDVSVTFSDSTAKRYIIANLSVPAP
jgi:hypothetical protein